jgi:surface carbohydrate biosynthesis protein
MISQTKIVIIHIDTLRKEYLGSWLLGEILKKNGYKVLLTSRHSTKRLLNFFTPDIFICTHVFQLNASEWKKLVDRGIKIYISESEGTDHEIGVSTTYPHEYAGQVIDYSVFSGIFVWGKFSYDWLIKNRNIDPQKVYLNGSIRQSTLCKPNRKKDSVVVGILSRFEIINTFDKRHPFANLMSIDPENPAWSWYFERCAIDSETFSIINKLADILIAQGHLVSIRPHPNENLEGYQLLKNKFGCSFSIDESYSINEWLSTVSVVLGTTSTAFTEPYIAKIPIISTSKIQHFHYSDADQAKLIQKFDMSAYTPASVSEAASLCIQLDLAPKSSVELDQYFKHFYTLDSPVDPIDRIVSVVDKDIQAGLHLSKLLGYFWATFILLCLDILFLVIGTIRSRNLRSLGTLGIYNYNMLLHKPSLFMKNILKRLI